MSGIRPTSGVTPGLTTGGTHSPAAGQGNVAPVTAATPAQNSGDLTANTSGRPEVRETLPQQTEIKAIVMAKSGESNVILHTEYGNFRLSTPTPLAVGSQVTFQVTNAEDVILAKLLSINGEALNPPPEIRLLPTIDKAAGDAANYLKAGQLHPVELKTGLQDLPEALSLAPLAGKAGAGTPPAALSPEAEVRLSALLQQAREAGMPVPDRASSPQQASAVQTPAAVPGGPCQAAPAAGQAAQAGTAAYQKRVPPQLPSFNPLQAAGTSKSATMPLPYLIVNATVLETRPDTMMPGVKDSGAFAAGKSVQLILRPLLNTAEPPRTDGGFLQGTVYAQSGGPGKSETGQFNVQLRTPAGNVSFTSPKPLPPGTVVQVAAADIISAFPLPKGEGRPAGAPLPKLALMTDWQNLRDAMNLVAQQDPLLAQNLVNNLIPQASSRLSSHLLFFMAALQLGSVEKWLGTDAAHVLRESGKEGLLKALDDDFKTFSRLQGTPGGQDWKALNFPFFDGNNLRQVRMFHRQRENPSAPEGEQKTTRFVIELNLSQSGPLQLDGLFKKKLFDLTIRSEQEVPGGMKSHILSLFSEHMEISGLAGQLVFKTIAPFPVNPLQEWEERIPILSGT